MKKRNYLFLICASMLCACSSKPDPVPPDPDPVVTKYSVSYTPDAHVNWSGPSSINEKTELRAAAIVHSGFLLDKSKITVTIADNVLDSNSYTYSFNVLIVPASFVTGKVVVTSEAYVDNRPIVDVEVSNTTNTFPTRIEAGTQLEGTLIPNKSYVLPKTIKIKSGDDTLHSPNDYTYNRETGKVTVFKDKVTSKITISGEASLKIKITFQVGEGSWSGQSDKEDKTADIGKGFTLSDAIKAGDIPFNPIADNPDLYFHGWYDDDTLINPNDVLGDDTVLVAKYGEPVVNIVYNTNNIDLTDVPYTIIPGAELNITLSASEGCALPDQDKVSVSKDNENVDFTYSTEDYRSANIVVDSTTTGDASVITITIDAYDSYTITFDPDGGKWGDQTDTSITISNIPLTSTYKDAINQLYDEHGVPSKDETVCANWSCDGASINRYQVIDGSAFKTLKAIYPEGATFYSDSWENVIDYANEGIDKLKEMYPEFADNFIGAEKPIKINNNVTAIARVIGINHDTTVSMDDTALTMEIDRVITIDNYRASGTTSTNRWADSQLRTRLNGEFLTKLKDLNEGFEPKTAQKYTISGQGAETTSQTVEYLFPLSGTEIGLPTTSATGEYSYNQKEGSIYEFYKTCGTDTQRIKYSIDGEDPVSYWLRSPVKKDSSNVFQVLSNGDYSIKDVTTDNSTNGYMVAFAI